MREDCGDGCTVTPPLTQLPRSSRRKRRKLLSCSTCNRTILKPWLPPCPMRLPQPRPPHPTGSIISPTKPTRRSSTANSHRPRRDEGRAKIYGQLAEVEDRHVEAWQKLLTEQGHAVMVPSPSRDARLRAWVARRIGPGVVLPLLLEEEGREVKSYLSMYREAPEGAAAPTALTSRSRVEGTRRTTRLDGRRGGGAMAQDRCRRASSATSCTDSTTG